MEDQERNGGHYRANGGHYRADVLMLKADSRLFACIRGKLVYLRLSTGSAAKDSSKPAPDLQSDRPDAPGQSTGAVNSQGCGFQRLQLRRDVRSSYACRPGWWRG